MAKPHAKPVINDDLRQEIAFLLLAGTPAPRIVQIISSRGLSANLVEPEVARAAKSPYLLAAKDQRTRLEARIAKRDWVLANTGRLNAQRHDSAQVPRFDRLDGTAFMADFYTNNRPCLVTGLADRWSARNWTFDQLKAQLGHVDVDVQWNREASPTYEIQPEAHTARHNFGHIIDRITTGGPSNDFYVTAFNSGHNKQALAPLWDDIADIPGWLAPSGGLDGFFWMGPQGTITPFHHDLTNNLMVQIAGEKRVKLVAASETPRMRNSRHCFSDWPDLPIGPGDDTHPPVLDVILTPGDTLFLPIGWWHRVEGLTPTIGLSFTNFAADNSFHSHYTSYGPL